MDLELIKTDLKKFIEEAKSARKEKNEKAQNYRKEYYEHDREQRDTQVGKTQQFKSVGNKQILPVRTIASFQKKIVSTSTAFEVGSPVTLIPSDSESDFAKMVTSIWKSNRIDSKIQTLITNKKVETQGALHFYIKDMKEENSSLLSKILLRIGINSIKKEIKCEILNSQKGTMCPVFDATGDMIAFIWQYETTNGDSKIKTSKIWDKKNVYTIEEGSKANGAPTTVPHGFDRIPIVYVEQDEPEWFDVRELIDRYETVLSKLGGSNDYTAYPILQIFGEVVEMPDKDDNGKVMRHPIKYTDEGKEVRGDAKFLTADKSVESITLEINELKNNIHSLSHTPQLSTDKLTGMGTLSGTALELMFLDAKIKASNNEGDNRTMIERILNVLSSGIFTTINTSSKTVASETYFEIEFNTILPNDFDGLVKTLSTAVSANIISRKSAVEMLGVAKNVDEELKDILSTAESSSKNVSSEEE